MEENTKERICYLLAENHKLRNLNDELEKELALKDEIIRKQICMMSEGKTLLSIMDLSPVAARPARVEEFEVYNGAQ